MTREEEIINAINQMCDEDREAEVVEMIDSLPEEDRTYKILGLEARTLSNLAGMIRSGYLESELDPDELDRRALDILTDTAEEGKDDPNWWCRNGYTRMGLNMEAEAIGFFEHVMTLIPDDEETQEFWSDVPEAIERCQSILDFLNNPKQRELPYTKQRSVMIAVSRDKTFAADMEYFTGRLATIPGVEGLEFEYMPDNQQTRTIERVSGLFMGEKFDLDIDRIEDFDSSGMPHGTYLNATDTALTERLNNGYGIDIKYGKKNPLAWFHLQLKIAAMLIPDLLAVCDLSGGQILSGYYVCRAAQSAIPPSPEFAYNIYTEGNKQGSDIWLYTCGLARFGLPEMEIMHSDTNHYACHRKLLRTVSSYAIWHPDDKLNETLRLDVPVARMAGDVPLFIRLLPWPDAIKDGQRDRPTPGSIRTRLSKMNSNSCVLFTYEDEAAQQEDAYQPLWMKDDFMTNDNAGDMLLLTSMEEQEQSKAMAKQYSWLPEQVARRNPGKVWLRLRLANDEGDDEALWARLVSYTDNSNFEIEIDDTPRVLPLDKGDRLRFVDESDVNLIKWMVDTEQFNITPENIYILDAEPKLRQELGIE